MELDLDKLNNADESTKYDGYDTYKNSKLAELVFAKELAERLKGKNWIKIFSRMLLVNESCIKLVKKITLLTIVLLH